MSDPIEIDSPVPGLRHIILNKPERGNALGPDQVEALLDALTDAASDYVHTVALSGNGKHFCTGFDLSDLSLQGDGDLLLRFVRIELLLATIWQAPFRTVALAKGRTWGAGADLFAACDIRVALPETRFKFPGAGFGLVLGTRRLAERIGPDATKSCVLTGREMALTEAATSGLVSDVLEAPSTFEDWLFALPEPVVSPVTRTALFAAVRGGGPGSLEDHDLAALVRSAARPGLRARMEAYAAGVGGSKRT